MKPPRRFHKKSRFGCTECKRRKIKCDERRPSCGACERLRTPCKYVLSVFQDTSSHPAANTDVVESLPFGEKEPEIQLEPTFDLLDLTLMHHYTSVTYRHLIAGKEQSKVWQQHVPMLASSNAVLMHHIIAVTALQYAESDATQRDVYVTRGFHHHSVSITGFQSLVATASSANAELIVISSILLTIWVYASFRLTYENTSLDHILDTIGIVRRSRSVFQLYRDVIMKTPIAIFLTPPLRQPLIEHSSSLIQDALRLLRLQVEHTADNDAISVLQDLLERYLAGADFRRSAANWVARVEDDYWARVREHNRDALLVLVYSSLISRASEHERWWLAGWSERVVLACSEVLSATDKESIGWEGHEGLVQTWGDEIMTLAKQRNVVNIADATE